MGVSFEIFATRDIQEGEEIFMDYGLEWETAWDDHIAQWKPPTGGDAAYKSIKLLQAEGIFEISDVRSEWSPKGNAMTVCVYWERRKRTYNRSSWTEYNLNSWTEMSDSNIIEKFGTNGDNYELDGPEEYGFFWPCSIIKKERNDRYTVRIFQSKSNELTAWEVKNIPCILTNY